MRFLSCVRCRTSTIRVRGRSRWSRNAPGGIQTVGSVPFRCSRLSPRTSSRSVLLISPIISFALRACTSLGTQPAASISSTIQYQLPIVSTATGDPRSGRQFEPSAQAIRNWVRQADRDAGRRQDGLTTVEQEEVRRLRRENRALREEREILRKAAAWFARETTSIPSKDSSS